jgi:hypothetical protein
MLKSRFIAVLGAAAVLALAAGCNEYKVSGSIVATQNVMLKDKKGKSIEVPAGTHSASLALNTKGDQLTISVKGSKAVKLAVPKGAIPMSEGKFHLASTSLGESYDFDGNVDTQTTETEPVRSIESCSWTEMVHECPDGRQAHAGHAHRTVAAAPDDGKGKPGDGGKPSGGGDEHGGGAPAGGTPPATPSGGEGPQEGDRNEGQPQGDGCKDVAVTHVGIRDVVTHNEITTITAELQLQDPSNNANVSATFNGSSTHTYTIVDHSGRCRTRD